MAELIISETLAAERLRELLEYFPETGIFRWRVSRQRVRVGSIAGCLNGDGYLTIMVDGKKHRAHRLAWLYVHGTWPKDQIDHINRDRADNRIENLREATPTENNRNQNKRYDNTSGHVGVSWSKAAQKWVAQIRHLGKKIHLGFFTEKEDAIAARAAAEIELWGALRTL